MKKEELKRAQTFQILSSPLKVSAQAKLKRGLTKASSQDSSKLLNVSYIEAIKQTRPIFISYYFSVWFCKILLEDYIPAYYYTCLSIYYL